MVLLRLKACKLLWKRVHYCPFHDCCIIQICFDSSRQKARGFGNSKIKEIFFWINLFYPSLMIGIQLLIKPDFLLVHDGFARIDRCLGDAKNNWGINSTRKQVKAHDICKNMMKALDEDNVWENSLYVLRNSVCWIHCVTLYLVTFNFFEIIAYWRIFTFMKK